MLFQYSVMKIADTRVGYTRVCFSDSLFQCPNDEVSEYQNPATFRTVPRR